MNKLTDELNKRIDVWGKVKTENAIGSIEYPYNKLKTIWAGIKVKPIGKTGKKSGEAETEYTETSHVFTIRVGAMDTLDSTMYLIFKGNRYDIDSIEPNYTFNDRIMVNATLKVE